MASEIEFVRETHFGNESNKGMWVESNTSAEAGVILF